MKYHDLPTVMDLIRRARNNGVNPDIVNYYHGMVMVMLNRPEDVKTIYSRINPDHLPQNLKENYFRICRDTRLILLHKRKN